MDERGLGLGISSFVAIIIVAALLYTLFTPAIGAINDEVGDQSESQRTDDKVALSEAIWQPILLYAILFGLVFIVSRAVFESRGVS